MANKIVAVNLQVNGSQAKQQVKEVNDNLNGAGESVKNFKQQLKEANNELAVAVQKYGRTSEEAVAAAKKVGQLKDEMGDAAALAESFNTDGAKSLKAFGQAVQGISGGFAALTGAMALFGTESEEVNKALLKVQAALAISQGVQQITGLKDAFENFNAVIKDSTAFKVIDTAVTEAATFVQTAFGVSVDTTAASFKALKIAIAATGIGLLVIGVIAVVNALKEASEAAEEAAQKQKLLNDLQKDAADSYKQAYTEIQTLKQEFKEAAGNSALQKKALEDFNNTVGDSTKQVKTFSEAQAFLSDDKQTQAYIDAMLARATATAAIGKAADANFEIISGYQKLQEELDKLANDPAAKKIADDAISYFKKTGDGASAATQLIHGVFKVQSTASQQAFNNMAEVINSLTDAQKTLTATTEIATQQSQKAEQVSKEHGWGTGTKYQNGVLENAIKEGLDKQMTAIDQQEKLAINEATRLMASEQAKFDIQVSYQMKRIDALKAYQKTVSGVNSDAAKDAQKQLLGAQNQLILMQDAYFTSTTNTLNAKVAEYVKKIANEDPGSKAPETTAEEDRQNRQQQQYNYHLYGVNSGQDVAPGYSGAANDTKAAIDRAGKNADATAKGKDDYGKALDDLKKQGDNLVLDTSSPGGFVASLANNLTALNTYFTKAKDLAKQGYGDLATVENAAADAKLNLWLTVGKTLLSAAADALGKQTAAGKAAAIAATTIDTFQSATAAYKAMVGIPVVGPVLAPIAAGAAVLAGVANVKKILAVKTPGGDAGGSSIDASVTAPVLPTVTPQATSTKLDQDQLNQIGNAASRNFVLDSDIQNNRDRDARLNRAARLGG